MERLALSRQSVSTLKKMKREAAAQRRPAQSERKNRVFPRNDRLYGLKCNAFQTEIALAEGFPFPPEEQTVSRGREMSLSTIVKRLQDIMRKDSGINGDAQRIEQIVWLLFLKIYDAKEGE